MLLYFWSISWRRRVFNVAKVPSSSAPISGEYPAASATRKGGQPHAVPHREDRRAGAARLQQSKIRAAEPAGRQFSAEPRPASVLTGMSGVVVAGLIPRDDRPFWRRR